MRSLTCHSRAETCLPETGSQRGAHGTAAVDAQSCGNTTNRGGLIVRARLDRRSYPIGKKVPAKDLRELRIDRDNFHGEWNYVIRPRARTVTD
jgi:hypothetical protein